MFDHKFGNPFSQIIKISLFIITFFRSEKSKCHFKNHMKSHDTKITIIIDDEYNFDALISTLEFLCLVIRYKSRLSIEHKNVCKVAREQDFHMAMCRFGKWSDVGVMIRQQQWNKIRGFQGRYFN